MANIKCCLVLRLATGEKMFEQSFCSFEFVASTDAIHDQFQQTPLHLELYLKDQYTSDKHIGTAVVNLSGVAELASAAVHARTVSR